MLIETLYITSVAVRCFHRGAFHEERNFCSLHSAIDEALPRILESVSAILKGQVHNVEDINLEERRPGGPSNQLLLGDQKVLGPVNVGSAARLLNSSALDPPRLGLYWNHRICRISSVGPNLFGSPVACLGPMSGHFRNRKSNRPIKQ